MPRLLQTCKRTKRNTGHQVMHLSITLRGYLQLKSQFLATLRHCEGGSMRKADKTLHEVDAHESEVKHPARLLCWKLKKTEQTEPTDPKAEVGLNELCNLVSSRRIYGLRSELASGARAWHYTSSSFPPPLSPHMKPNPPDPPCQLSLPVTSASALNRRGWRGREILLKSQAKGKRRNEDAYTEFLCETV